MDAWGGIQVNIIPLKPYQMNVLEEVLQEALSAKGNGFNGEKRPPSWPKVVILKKKLTDNRLMSNEVILKKS